MNYLAYVIVGLLAGVLGGLTGVCGAILIPALVLFLGFSQHQAQGTTLAVMVMPIGLLAALRYWQAGHVKLPIVAFICIGWLIGALVGANFAQSLSDPMLRRIFGLILLFVSLRMIFFKV